MKDKIYALMSILVLMIINHVIVPPLGYSFVTPYAPIAGIIYWLVKKKELITNLNIFILGLFNDLTFSTPIGSSIIIYAIIKFFFLFVEGKIVNNSIFLITFKSFLGITLYYSLTYTFIIIYYKKYPSINYFIMSYLLTLFIFPIIYIIFNWIFTNKKLEE